MEKRFFVVICSILAVAGTIFYPSPGGPSHAPVNSCCKVFRLFCHINTEACFTLATYRHKGEESKHKKHFMSMSIKT